METDSCEFCYGKGSPLRVPAGEGVEANIYVCNKCWKLLQNPMTALPLLRGNINLALRGVIPEVKLKTMTNNFMEKIASWRAKEKN